MPAKPLHTKGLTARYLSVLIVLGVLASGIFLISRVVLNEQTVSIAVQSVGDQQRTLLTEAITYARRFANSKSERGRERLREKLLETLSKIEALHIALAYGDPSRKLPAEPPPLVRRLFFGPLGEADRHMREFLDRGNAMAMRFGDEAGTVRSDLDYLIRVGNALVSHDLDRIVTAYLSRGEGKVRNLRYIQNVGLFLTFVVLAFAGFGIFRPMVAQLGRDMEASKEYSSSLEKAVAARMSENTEAQARIAKLVEVGIALSAERDFDNLVEMILLEAKRLSNADGGTVYLLHNDQLEFAVVHNDTLDIAYRGKSGMPYEFPPLQLHSPETGEPNKGNLATYVALTGETVKIADIYEETRFDFTGSKAFDEKTGYRSRSFLSVPLINRMGKVVGVLQLINAHDPETKQSVPFSDEVIPFIESFASQASIAIDNRLLIDEQRFLLDSFIELVAGAIDAKSPYTGGHCQRVPELAAMLAEAACESNEGSFVEFHLNEDQWYEFHVAAWLHDCGKVTTPEYVVDKATKLEMVYNRIHEIRMRFEVLRRDAEIEFYKSLVEGEDRKIAQYRLDSAIREIEEDFAFVAECNIGSEEMDPSARERLAQIAEKHWTRTLDDRLGLSHETIRRLQDVPAPALPVEESLLADKPEHLIPWQVDPNKLANGKFVTRPPAHKFNYGELYNLSVTRGTLTEEERYLINDHIIQTIIMLEQLPFPDRMKKVPEYAGGHHEKMDGGGYPRGLTREQMSIPARIMAIADIFEALTASDRPYKKAKTLSESIRIMHAMKQDRHIDPELFELFLSEGVYRRYAEKFLDAEQIDEVDVAPYLAEELLEKRA
jgi:HD-GYP domain-containing protein (c-di-GMP phosphodiesterase class II)